MCVCVRPTFLWSLGGPVAAPGEIMGVVDAIRRNQKVMHGSWRVEQVRAERERERARGADRGGEIEKKRRRPTAVAATFLYRWEKEQ